MTEAEAIEGTWGGKDDVMVDCAQRTGHFDEGLIGVAAASGCCANGQVYLRR